MPVATKMKMLKEIEGPHGKTDAMTRFMQIQSSQPSKKHLTKYILSEKAKLKAKQIERILSQ